MPRKPNPDLTQNAPRDEVATEVTSALVAAHDQARQIEAEQAQRTQELAVQLRFEGDLSPPALVAGIRFARNQLGAAIFDMGTRLLLLKSAVGHGAFGAELAALDIDPRAAQRFMSTTLKLGKYDTLSHLTGNGTFTKLIELTVLDDEELQVLAGGGEVRGVTIDDVESMTAKDLRKALRDAREQLKAKDAHAGKVMDKLRAYEEAEAHPAHAKRLAEKQRQDLFRSVTQQRLAALAELPQFLVLADELSTMGDQGGDEEAGAHVMAEVGQLVETFCRQLEAYGYDVMRFMPEGLA